MSPCRPAHHPKLEVPSEHAVRMASLYQAHLQRLDALRRDEFFPVDPLTREQRRASIYGFYSKRIAARAWLADKPQRRRERMRASWLVIAGGRS